MASALINIAPEGNLSRYLQEIRKFPMLSPEDELALASGLPSFFVASQIGHGQLRLADPASLLVTLVNNLRLHYTVSCTASPRLSFRFSRSKLTH